MYRNLLNKKFFKENPYKEMSAQRLLYSSILMPEIVEYAREIVKKMTDRATQEANEIEMLVEPLMILKRLRGNCDNLNFEILHKKVLEYEDILVPKIIEMLKTSLNNVFIEQSARILPKCRKNYSKELLEILDVIRNPYALSYVCIVLGCIGDEDVIPIIYNKYFELNRDYKDENYAQGPLLALYELNARFYCTPKNLK